MDAIRGVVVVA